MPARNKFDLFFGENEQIKLSTLLFFCQIWNSWLPMFWLFLFKFCRVSEKRLYQTLAFLFQFLYFLDFADWFFFREFINQMKKSVIILSTWPLIGSESHYKSRIDRGPQIQRKFSPDRLAGNTGFSQLVSGNFKMSSAQRLVRRADIGVDTSDLFVRFIFGISFFGQNETKNEKWNKPDSWFTGVNSVLKVIETE